VPKPFSPVGVCIAPPQFVAPDADDAGAEAARQRLESTLLDLMPRAAALARA
jgi:lysophospholipid acyltransferase (LPLAT)-like uncharacterized protein